MTIIAAGCFVVACCIIIRQIIQDRHTQESLDDLRASVETSGLIREDIEVDTQIPTDTSQPTADTDAETGTDTSTDADADAGKNSQSTDTEAVANAIPNPYADVFASNPDIAGWLTIPDTVIDYPVMWTPEDENYYLYRDVDGSENKNGCLILDTDSCVSPLSTNLIIHGHNMRSGAMFGNLTDYEDPDYCESHKHITLYTEECQRNYEVIAAFRSQVYKKKDTVFKYYKFFQADTEEEFNDFYQNIKNLSLYDTGVTAEFGDRFITLSTCVYHVEQGRFVVVAKEVESGDTYLPIQE